MTNAVEKVFWSIAFPGFGQILNGKIAKGLLFIFLEFSINVNANLNEVIIFSFTGDISQAIAKTNYEWMMFYPCVYSFAIWDAFRDAGGGKSLYSFLPTVFCAYIGTLGVTYSPFFEIFGTRLGPILLGLMGMVSGALIGWIAQAIIIRNH
ncbi:hypothetical protein [Pelosinus propionicus]|uniref:Uncharacterized protein n=1 Tax=Pelosinus propionicus DSM 13327 TaxID=1123291 RepID=A0A1I4MDQ9_9FIRM|nr:hypothetical protein [Pelosinus propionicus]SFM01165.1 hypothetical protein SAMN04490355_103243 [Pelosinus propionicus DSM 13327]